MRLMVCAVVLLSIASCSESTSSKPSSTTSSAAPAAEAATAAPATAGTVSGKATPGAIVMLEPKTARQLPESDTPVMDQVALTFTPPVLFVRTGQPVEFRNSDDTLHNVHVGNSDTKEPSFNVAIPTGEKYRYTFAKDGFYHVGCDIHPAMAAEIFSVSTPFVMMADASGGFEFADVPPGTYVARSIASGVRNEREVEIKAGANAIAIAP